MRPCITPDYYYSPDIFRQEQVQLLQDWQYVGTTSDLKNNNDYICTEIAGDSVFIKNCEGELKAFQNVCSHRFSRIHPLGCGQGLTQCPYHGWVYDKEGQLFGIPQKSRFPELAGASLEEFRLQRWQVETCGTLVFVRKNPPGVSLQEFLGETYSVLESFSRALGSKIDVNELVIKANWKILVENTLESYHVNRVHPQSFQRLGVAGDEFQFTQRHSSWRAELHDTINQKWSRLNRSFQTRPYQISGYFHQLIFPNLTLATTYGMSFSLQFFQPINASETRFISEVFQTRVEGLEKSQQALVEALGQSVVSFNRQVFAEDKAICEQVQLGVAATRKRGILSAEEQRVYEFQKAYLEAMNTEQPIFSEA